MILPSSFEAYTQQLMGTQLYDKFITGLNSQQPTSIRINPFKIRQLLPSQTKPATQGQPKANATTTSSTPDDTKATDTTLAEDTAMSTLLVEGARRVPWCQWGWYLPTRPSFTFDPLLHAGLYYVQESSSMFICEVVRQSSFTLPCSCLTYVLHQVANRRHCEPHCPKAPCSLPTNPSR